MGDEIAHPLALEFKHFATAIKKAAEVYQRDHFFVVGRGSLSASMPTAPATLRTTADIDLFSTFDKALVDAWAEADPSVGAGSEFFAENGFYIERVGEWTLMEQPAGWQERAIALQIEGIDVLVLHPLDLAYNKLEAGRPKDIEFMREGLTCKAYDYVEVLEFIQKHAPDSIRREEILENLRKAAA